MSQTIALVDDDRNILTGISMALEREGFKVQLHNGTIAASNRLNTKGAQVEVLFPKFS
jgi:two-component system response regulator ChvI